MSQSAELIDFAFGDAQLGGNRTLYISLLTRFYNDYQHAADSFHDMIANGRHDDARHSVHTIKGVSGNLGLKALHQTCKPLETALKDGDDIDGNFNTFLNCLKETLKAISSAGSDAPAEGDTKPAAAANAEADANGKKTLEKQLQQNLFIPPDELDKLLAGIDMPGDMENTLREAIDDLDYPAALELLATLP